MKKIFALLLACATLLLTVSCAKTAGDAPDGYKLASNDALCDYAFYVPEVWVTESNNSNYSIATLSGADKATLSVAKLENVYAENLDEYWKSCKDDYAFLSDFTVLSQGTNDKGEAVEWEKTTVGTGDRAKTGFRYVFTGKFGDTEYKYQQIFVVHGGAFSSALYCITYTAPAANYDMHLETVNAALAYFYFK